MELLFFVLAVVLGLIIYFYVQNRKKSKRLQYNYYYKRFLRNKFQTEKNIQEFEKILKLYNNSNVFLIENHSMTLEEYYVQLKKEFYNDYSDAILKLLKKNKLKNKDKKKYAKILIAQSEKLYNTEVDIAYFNEKLKEINCISV